MKKGLYKIPIHFINRIIRNFLSLVHIWTLGRLRTNAVFVQWNIGARGKYRGSSDCTM